IAGMRMTLPLSERDRGDYFPIETRAFSQSGGKLGSRCEGSEFSVVTPNSLPVCFGESPLSGLSLKILLRQRLDVNDMRREVITNPQAGDRRAVVDLNLANVELLREQVLGELSRVD